MSLLEKAVDMLLASAPAHMTHRNAAEREAYRLMREARAVQSDAERQPAIPLQFRTAEELAAWLESLCEMTPDGAIIANAPWEPAQRAARALRATAIPIVAWLGEADGFREVIHADDLYGRTESGELPPNIKWTPLGDCAVIAAVATQADSHPALKQPGRGDHE